MSDYQSQPQFEPKNQTQSQQPANLPQDDGLSPYLMSSKRESSATDQSYTIRETTLQELTVPK